MGISNIIKLYEKLKNDFSEQKDEIIIKDLSGKRKIRYGGCFLYEEDGFEVGTSFDFENYSITNGPLNFKFIDEKLFDHLSRFWNKLHTSDNLIWYKDYEVYSIRDKIKNKEEITISNSKIDNNVIKFLAKFKNLKVLTFSDCDISKECNFSELNKLDIEFDNCNIESFDVFSMSNNNLIILSSNVEKIGHGLFYGKKLDINNFTPEQINLLLLCWNFPNLKTLYIKNKTFDNNVTYDLKYLTKSAPNLTDLQVSGKVKSMNFLLGMTQMINCGILSNSDELGLFIPEIEDEEERKKIMEKYKDEVEFLRILDESHYESKTDFSASIQYMHFLKMCEFYKKISYSEKEKESLISSFISNYFQYVKSDQFPNLNAYYKAIGDTMTYKEIETVERVIAYYNDKIKKYWDLQKSIGRNIEFIKQEDMIEFEHEFIFKRSLNSRIVKGIPYIYYIDGHPIELIYCQNTKKISTIEEALKYRKENPKSERINKFEEAIEEFKNLGYTEDLSLGLMLSVLDESYSIYFDYDDLKQFKNYLIENYDDVDFMINWINIKIKRFVQRKNIIKKIYDYYSLFINMILDNYELFNNKEKKAILTLIIKKDYLDEMPLGKESNYVFFEYKPDRSRYIEENEYLIIETWNDINKKTNNQYEKYIKRLDKYVELYRKILLYDINISPEEYDKIKKIKSKI